MSKIKFKLYKFFRTKISFAKLEKKARKNLDLSVVDLFEDIHYPEEEDIKKFEKIEKEIKDFKDFYQDF